jgi:hypothetical protein
MVEQPGLCRNDTVSSRKRLRKKTPRNEMGQARGGILRYIAARRIADGARVNSLADSRKLHKRHLHFPRQRLDHREAAGRHGGVSATPAATDRQHADRTHANARESSERHPTVHGPRVLACAGRARCLRPRRGPLVLERCPRERFVVGRPSHRVLEPLALRLELRAIVSRARCRRARHRRDAGRRRVARCRSPRVARPPRSRVRRTRAPRDRARRRQRQAGWSRSRSRRAAQWSRRTRPTRRPRRPGRGRAPSRRGDDAVSRAPHAGKRLPAGTAGRLAADRTWFGEPAPTIARVREQDERRPHRGALRLAARHDRPVCPPTLRHRLRDPRTPPSGWPHSTTP